LAEDKNKPNASVRRLKNVILLKQAKLCSKFFQQGSKKQSEIISTCAGSIEADKIFLYLELYGLLQAFFIEGDPHSHTRHIERVNRRERDIVPSTQD
jgi:hypothetical protein